MSENAPKPSAPRYESIANLHKLWRTSFNKLPEINEPPGRSSYNNSASAPLMREESIANMIKGQYHLDNTIVPREIVKPKRSFFRNPNRTRRPSKKSKKATRASRKRKYSSFRRKSLKSSRKRKYSSFRRKSLKSSRKRKYSSFRRKSLKSSRKRWSTP